MTNVATYTSVNDVDLHQVAEQYGLVDVQLIPLDGGAANSSFRANSESGTYVLTVLDNHDQASAEKLAAHTEALFRLGIPTAEVIHNTTGQAVSLVGGRPVFLKRWIEGQVVDLIPDELLPLAGGLLATLHQLPPSELPDLPTGTRRLSAQHLAAISDFPDQTFARWLHDRLTTVQTREADLPNLALVISHGDIFADNVIVQPDGELAIIDWETVSLDSALLDLGMTLLGLANVNGKLDQTRAALIVTGYTNSRPLTLEELNALPSEVEHAALIIAFHRYHRHNVRFPNPAKSQLHTEMIGFVESLTSFNPAH